MTVLPYWAKQWFVLFWASEMWAVGGLVTVLASPVVECICGQSDHSEEEFAVILIHIPRHAFHLRIFATVPEGKVRVVNNLPFLGTKVEAFCCLHPLCEFLWVWVYDVEMQPRKFQWFGTQVLFCFVFFFFFHTSIQEYAFMVCGMSILVKYKRQMHDAALLSSNMLIYIA